MILCIIYPEGLPRGVIGANNDGPGILGDNMATVTLSNSTVIENPHVGTIVGFIGVTGEGASENAAFRLIDPGSCRFEIKPISQEGIFNWVLVVKNSVSGDGSSLFDFENDALNQFTFKISATGDVGTVVAMTTFTVSVTDNTAPTEVILSDSSVVEHAQTGTTIGYLWAFDPDDDETFTYTLTDDAGGRFAIVGDNLVVKDGSLLDYQAAKSHRIMVEVRDSDGNVHTESLTINVSDAVDLQDAAATDDQLFGSAEAALLQDLSGNNKLYGSADDDVINGLGGNDKLYGLAGNDTLNGGVGKDIVSGGDGADTFVFDAPLKKGHFDQIRDFKSGQDKAVFDLDALKTFKVKASKSDLLDFAKKGKPDKKFSVELDKVFKEGKLEKKFFNVGTASDDRNDYIVYTKSGTVYLDVDGSGSAKPIEILKLKPGTALAFSDFLFI
jgi:Ca2+-binding RTX toxin-like protein